MKFAVAKMSNLNWNGPWVALKLPKSSSRLIRLSHRAILCTENCGNLKSESLNLVEQKEEKGLKNCSSCSSCSGNLESSASKDNSGCWRRLHGRGGWWGKRGGENEEGGPATASTKFPTPDPFHRPRSWFLNVPVEPETMASSENRQWRSKRESRQGKVFSIVTL